MERLTPLIFLMLSLFVVTASAANLTETARWENGIYRIELTDPVEGGEDGIDNRQAKQLGNRTLFLRREVNKLKTKTNETNAEVDSLKTEVNKNTSDISALKNNTGVPSHNHDDRYYTQTESDARFATKNHDHSNLYLTDAQIDSKITSAMTNQSIEPSAKGLRVRVKLNTSDIGSSSFPANLDEITVEVLNNYGVGAVTSTVTYAGRVDFNSSDFNRYKVTLSFSSIPNTSVYYESFAKGTLSGNTLVFYVVNTNRKDEDGNNKFFNEVFTQEHIFIKKAS